MKKCTPSREDNEDSRRGHPVEDIPQRGQRDEDSREEDSQEERS